MRRRVSLARPSAPPIALLKQVQGDNWGIVSPFAHWKAGCLSFRSRFENRALVQLGVTFARGVSCILGRGARAGVYAVHGGHHGRFGGCRKKVRECGRLGYLA